MRYPQVFDLSRLYTNNITVMNETYGIEAARAALQRVRVVLSLLLLLLLFYFY